MSVHQHQSFAYVSLISIRLTLVCFCVFLGSFILFLELGKNSIFCQNMKIRLIKVFKPNTVDFLSPKRKFMHFLPRFHADLASCYTFIELFYISRPREARNTFKLNLEIEILAKISPTKYIFNYWT